MRLGATEISNSWGGEEPVPDSPAFDHPKTVITAAAGDDGYLNWTGAKEAGEERYVGADYPASSPHVVAVGGTKLTLSTGGARQSETVWNEDPAPEGGNEGAGGGGCSTRFTAPLWQQAVADWASVGCGSERAVADVAADADPYTGVAVYDSVPYEEEGRSTVFRWVPIGGTSVASPIVASMFAITDEPHEVAYPAQTLYSHLGDPSLDDVTAGGNGKCDGLYTSGCSGSMEPLSPLFPLDCGSGALVCNAAPGYDGPTGVGAPNGLAAFEPGSEAEHSNRVQARKAAEQKAEEERAAEEVEHAAERQAEEELRARQAEEAEAARAVEARKAEEERVAEQELKEEEAARGGFGEGSTGKGGGGGETTGGGRLLGGSVGGGLGSHPSGASTGSGGSSPTTVRLSRLALTARASAVIARGLPTLAQVAFAFTLSAPARVRVALSRQVRVHGRLRWVSVPGALTLAAGAGRDRGHLRGRRALSPGRYRLTLSPAHGGARSIVFVPR